MRARLCITVAVALLAVYVYSTFPTYPTHFTTNERVVFYLAGILTGDTGWKVTLENLGVTSSVSICRSLVAAALQIISWAQVQDKSLFKASEIAGVPVRTFQPKQNQEVEKKTPIIIYFHGGGFCVGSSDTHHDVCEYIALKAEMKVISVDYRLAPECIFPAAIDDAYAVTKAIMQDSNVDRTQVSLVGDSAGGNLVMAVIVRWHSEGMDKHLGKFASQILIYPLLQLFYFNTKSYRTVVQEQTSLTTRTIHTGYSLYAAGNRSLVPLFQSGRSISRRNVNKIVKGLWQLPVTDEELNHYPDETTIYESILTNPLLSPLAVESVEGFPPAFILTAEYDVLRDDGVIYANRLKQAGVHVEILNVHKCHAFINFLKSPIILPVAIQSMDSVVKFLNTTRHEVDG